VYLGILFFQKIFCYFLNKSAILNESVNGYNFYSTNINLSSTFFSTNAGAKKGAGFFKPFYNFGKRKSRYSLK